MSTLPHEPAHDARPHCVLGLTSETLSTWRARGLPAAEAARVAAHAPACSACQRHLAAYDAIDTALRRHEPLPRVGDGQRLRAWVAAAPTAGDDAVPRVPAPPRLAERPIGVGRRGRWNALVTAAAVLLIVAGFAAMLARGPLGVGRSTPALVWHESTLPVDAVATAAGGALALTPGSADVAYLCLPSTPTLPSATVWRQGPPGQPWKTASVLPLTAPVAQCRLQADQLDAAVLTAAALERGASASGPNWIRFASFDGGFSWRQLGDHPGYPLGEHATWRGVTYAIRAVAVASGAGGMQPVQRLFMSMDQMRTWHEIDGPLLASLDEYPPPTGSSWQARLFVRQSDGQIYAQFWPGALWTTTNQGLTWGLIRVSAYRVLPRGAPASEALTPLGASSGVVAVSFLIAQSPTGGVVTICALESGGSNGRLTTSAPQQPLACSADGGFTWARRPQPFVSSGVALLPQAVLADGSIIADSASGAIYLLPAGASSERQWQRLGQYPPLDAQAIVTNGKRVMLWAWTTSGTTWRVATASVLVGT